MSGNDTVLIDGVLYQSNGLPKGGKKESIFAWILEKNSDLEILDKFLCTFPEVIEAEKLWEYLEKKFSSLPNDLKKPQPPVDPLLYIEDSFLTTPQCPGKTPLERITYFLWHWIDRCLYRDFLSTKNSLYHNLLKFIQLLGNDTANKLKLLIFKTFIKRVEKINKHKTAKNSSEFRSPLEHRDSFDKSLTDHSQRKKKEGINSLKILSGSPILGGRIPSKQKDSGEIPDIGKTNFLEPGNFEFHDLSPDQVANQLTLIEWETFSSIEDRELLHLNWKSSDSNPQQKKKLSRNVVKLVERFNNVSYWVATEILMHLEPLVRVKTIKKFIQIAERLRIANNFNGVMEIVGGLNLWPIQRLKKTWEEVGEAKKIIDELDQLMETKSNYKNYRNALKQAKPPALPYLGVFLRDLLFIEEGNPDFVGKKEDEIINFEKLMLMGDVIMQIKQLQQAPYRYNYDSVMLAYLKKVQILPEELLYKHSTLCEPQRTEEKISQ